MGLLVSSCSGSSDGEGGLQAALDGRTFVSESVEGWQLVPGTEVRLRFRGEKLQAGAGCNSIDGTISITGNTLNMPGYGMTSMGCDAPRHAQDQWLVEFLRASPSLELVEPRLNMTTADARMTLLDREVASPDRPLAGTQWRSDGFGDGNSVSGPGSPNVTAFFDPSGTVTITTGCQTGSGTYSVTGAQLAFASFAYDGAACADPGLQQFHDQVLLVLDGAPVSFDIEEVRLMIHRDNYTLFFRAAN